MLARLISIIFHPLLMPTYLFSLLAWTLPVALDPVKIEFHFKFLLFIFMITFLLPLLIMGIFRAFGTIATFTLAERRERLLPFVFISSTYLAITYMFYAQSRMSVSDNFFRFMLIIDGLVVAATLCTFFFKISVHSVAAWGLIGILLPLNKITEVQTLFYPTLIVIVLAGIIMSARLQLGAHTSREVMWGGVVGLALSLSGMLILF